MNKKAFLDALGKGLCDLSYEEQDKWLDFYGEMIEDRMEEGISEEEAVAAIGSVEAITRQILSEHQTERSQVPEQPMKAEKAPGRTWPVLLIAGAAIALIVLIPVWSCIIALYAAAVSLIACGLIGLAALPIFIHNGHAEAGLFCAGAGLFCGGVGIALFVGVNYLTKGILWLCKKMFRYCFPRREASA